MRKQILLLVLMMLPMAVLADKDGKCGDNVTFHFSESTGTLTIEGSGPMYDYEGKGAKVNTPWKSLVKKVKSVVIEDGVTTIGSCAFRLCKFNTSVSIPESVVKIGEDAFGYNTMLAAISIPSGVKEIGKFAFMSCESLQTVEIPLNVVEIGAGTFTICKNLESVMMPDGVETIGYGAFEDCERLKEIRLPKSLAKIDQRAFYNCKSLPSVYIPHLVSWIDSQAFAGCSGLTAVYLPSSVSRMGYNAFGGCDKITAIYIPKGNVDIMYSGLNINRVVKREPDASLFAMAETPTKTVAAKPATATTPQPQPKQEVKPQPKQEVKPQPKSDSTPVREQATAPQPYKETVPDVDRNIFVSDAADKNTFAVIIGNEKYRDEADVPFAENDAKVFSEYCQKTLGIAENHIRLIVNAGFNDIRRAVSWLRQGMEAYSGKGRIIFYYAGHGIPSEQDKSAYLLPVDGVGSDIETAYSLSQLYKLLSEMPAQSATVFLDACFSGAKREGGMMASARGVAIKAKPQEAMGKMVVFTAAQGDETAYPYKSQRHGMFTYYLLRKLQETRGNVTLGPLADYLTNEVKRESFDVNNKMQTPSVSASPAFSASWRQIKLK